MLLKLSFVLIRMAVTSAHTYRKVTVYKLYHTQKGLCRGTEVCPAGHLALRKCCLNVLKDWRPPWRCRQIFPQHSRRDAPWPAPFPAPVPRTHRSGRCHCRRRSAELCGPCRQLHRDQRHLPEAAALTPPRQRGRGTERQLLAKKGALGCFWAGHR